MTSPADTMPPDWMAGPGQPHGGMLAVAMRQFPNAPRPFIDLSTGINPHPYPMPALSPEAFTRLPDDSAATALQEAAARAYGVADAAMVAPAPGTQLLISLLPRLLPLRAFARVAILSPTYGEHAAAWTQAGHQVTPVDSLDAMADSDIAILCNPNNPDGCRHQGETLRRLADRLAARGSWLVVDEAFIDLEPQELSLASHLPHPGIVILRSFGKTYGLAGLRLGFALASPKLAAHIRQSLGPWAISGPALAAGTQALADTAWRASSIVTLDRETARLDTLLARSGLSLIGGTRLFRLYASPRAPSWHAILGQAGILVRRFAGATDRLRLGLPADETQWQRLQAALAVPPSD